LTRIVNKTGEEVDILKKRFESYFKDLYLQDIQKEITK
jgi:hypothetical protein